MQHQSKILQNAPCALSQYPIYGTVSPTVRRWVQELGEEGRNDTTHHSIPSVLKPHSFFPFCSPDSMLFCSRVLTSKEKSSPSKKHTNETIELEATVSALLLRVLHVSDKGVTALAGAADPMYQEKKKLGHCSTTKARKHLSAMQGISQDISTFPCPVKNVTIENYNSI